MPLKDAAISAGFRAGGWSGGCIGTGESERISSMVRVLCSLVLAFAVLGMAPGVSSAAVNVDLDPVIGILTVADDAGTADAITITQSGSDLIVSGGNLVAGA